MDRQANQRSPHSSISLSRELAIHPVQAPGGEHARGSRSRRCPLPSAHRNEKGQEGNQVIPSPEPGVFEHPRNHCKTTPPNRKIEMSVSTAASSTPNPARCKDARRRCRDHWKRQAELKNRARNVALANPGIPERRTLC